MAPKSALLFSLVTTVSVSTGAIMCRVSAKINNSCRFLLLFSLFYNVYRYISSFFVSSGVSHTHTVYLPTCLHYRGVSDK